MNAKFEEEASKGYGIRPDFGNDEESGEDS